MVRLVTAVHDTQNELDMKMALGGCGRGHQKEQGKQELIEATCP